MSLCIIKLFQHTVKRTSTFYCRLNRYIFFSKAELQKMQFSLTSAMFTRFTDDTQGLLIEMHSREQLNPFFFPGLFISNHHFLGDPIKVI